MKGRVRRISVQELGESAEKFKVDAAEAFSDGMNDVAQSRMIVAGQLLSTAQICIRLESIEELLREKANGAN